MSAIVAIVGRPNVGKSTFFNRMIQKREAIVDAVSGVTRDRHYGKTDWNGRDFSLIDTGGYVVGSDDIFEKEIDKQVKLAIEEADAIIFMVEVETGLTGMDEEVAQLLRRSKKPVFLAVNKVDNAMRQDGAVEFYSLGFDSVFIYLMIYCFSSWAFWVYKTKVFIPALGFNKNSQAGYLTILVTIF